MTMISRLGFKPTKRQTLKSDLLRTTEEVTIIIPVKDNQNGIDLFLTEFFTTHSADNFPREIIIVDNNSAPKIELKRTDFPIPVRLLTCSKIGPASARNFGVQHSQTDWILFTDSDCVPTSNLLTGYLKVQNGSVGYAGNIKAHGQDIISKYYEQQEILVPPKVYERPNEPRPDYLITANCLVWRPAFDKVGGFNETIKIAGGEDIDLGFKLLNIGQLTYAFDSIAKHNFGYGLRDFKERFVRYGNGNKIISKLYDLDLKPKTFKPNKPTLINFILAFMQYIWLTTGYKNEVTI
jgi:glycosyltransferase involved in cell wall biosynthesis